MGKSANIKVKLTPTQITKRTKATPDKGRSYDVLDTEVPGLSIRVTNGHRSYTVRGRLPGAKEAIRRTIGSVDTWTLEKARKTARAWLELIKEGKDPALEKARQAVEARTHRENTFGAVAKGFIDGKLPRERKGDEVEADIRREFIPAWGALPIAEVTKLHVIKLIKAKAKGTPAQARNLLGIAKRLLQWAVDDGYLEHSPAAGLKPANLCGDKVVRERVFSDAEIEAFWRTTYAPVSIADRADAPDPAAAVYRLLLLTGLRLNEVADAKWSEFDFAKGVWTIPASRMKGKNKQARQHTVPLTEKILAEVEAMPIPLDSKGKQKADWYVFSLTFGESPIWISDKMLKRFRGNMQLAMRALAHSRGEDIAKVELPKIVNHDIRRTVRTRLSGLTIPEEVREAVLAHTPQGVKKHYDHNDYLPAKRDALEKWYARLREIIEPTPANVVKLHASA